MAVQASNSPPTIDARPVLDLANRLGFGLVGIAPASPSEHSDFVRNWLSQGMHGEMDYLNNHLDTRLDPAKLLSGARSILCVADKHLSQTDLKPSGPGPHGRIARYAWGDDYHKTLKKRLHQLADALSEAHPGEQFRSTVDTAPMLEREHAAVAGLGWIGKHTLLIHPAYGSYFLLGTILTTLNLRPSADDNYPPPTVTPTDHCGTCTRCIDACPTNCISSAGPRSIDATRCISYLTLEHRSEITPDLHGQMGDWIAGCDVCQEVCPHNRDHGTTPDAPSQSESRFAPLPIHERYTPRPPAPGLSLLNILDWTEEDRREAFRGSALKRIKLGMFKRNALIAAGNALLQKDNPGLKQRIEQIAEDHDEPELVRVTARQTLARLAHGSGRACP